MPPLLAEHEPMSAASLTLLPTTTVEADHRERLFNDLESNKDHARHRKPLQKSGSTTSMCNNPWMCQFVLRTLDDHAQTASRATRIARSLPSRKNRSACLMEKTSQHDRDKTRLPAVTNASRRRRPKIHPTLSSLWLYVSDDHNHCAETLAA